METMDKNQGTQVVQERGEDGFYTAHVSLPPREDGSGVFILKTINPTPMVNGEVPLSIQMHTEFEETVSIPSDGFINRMVVVSVFRTETFTTIIMVNEYQDILNTCQTDHVESVSVTIPSVDKHSVCVPGSKYLVTIDRRVEPEIVEENNPVEQAEKIAEDIPDVE